jgi:hypothetical protein
MRFLFTAICMLLLVACAAGERIYDASEVDEPPALVGDSLIIVAPPPEGEFPPPGGHN